MAEERTHIEDQLQDRISLFINTLKHKCALDETSLLDAIALVSIGAIAMRRCGIPDGQIAASIMGAIEETGK